MKLHVYCSTWNDLYMLRWFVRHYSHFADRIFVYDDDSTDGTREYLESCAPLVQIMSPGFHGIDEVLLRQMRENEYKKHSRGIADWVIIGDSDELHWHPYIFSTLTKLKNENYAAIVSHAWQMFSEEAPTGNGQLTNYVKEGIRDPMYDRLIFRPELDMSIPPGMHDMRIMGDDGTLGFSGMYPVHQNHEFKMLHYRFLSEEFVKERSGRAWSRFSQRNKDMGWGIHTSPGWKQNYGIEWYRQMLKERKPCID